MPQIENTQQPESGNMGPSEEMQNLATHVIQTVPGAGDIDVIALAYALQSYFEERSKRQ